MSVVQEVDTDGKLVETTILEWGISAVQHTEAPRQSLSAEVVTALLKYHVEGWLRKKLGEFTGRGIICLHITGLKEEKTGSLNNGTAEIAIIDKAHPVFSTFLSRCPRPSWHLLLAEMKAKPSCVIILASLDFVDGRRLTVGFPQARREGVLLCRVT